MEIIFHTNFRKRFKKLPSRIQKQFYNRLEMFSRDKFQKILNNHPVEQVFPDCQSINITGDYRAIFKDHKHVIIFISIGTHSDLY
ncbi:MAG: hypothetical protein A2826_00850 [Candidatus Doudnabacteria bacterium RIFCSPHIGHO2_01_FULL_43_23]|uniref:Plasmid stabilization protein n=1 Tax=Candidatus Doudnabacteria bacterium RIFCSPHIGHO2_01_FULL_43_23 TaxID=1817822 RepID=A0A1F5NRD7_9BACT|nr:MAG: hypothetical protein A2826_00850 [Candidatus Doudnabacteria bacterium RIFCSPHIGHO2_01_FULL_43_23]